MTISKPKDGVTHKWTFLPRFRRHAFGWRSQPAIQRIKEAVSEIKKVARKDPNLAAEGAVRFIEKVVGAIEHVDSSSGSMGTAVYNAIEALVPIIAAADVDGIKRDKWLERLWQAFEEDGYSYIETLGDHWGALCSSEEIASQWADRFIDRVRLYWKERKAGTGYFRGVTACLSCLLTAGRHQELIDLLNEASYTFWSYHRFGFLALAAMGQHEAALKFAEQCGGPNDGHHIDQDCENLLISVGEVEQAYQRYAMHANASNTRINTFRSITKKYPTVDPDRILNDLIASTPGEEGKWFATARKLGYMDLALDLANRSPCDPLTLNRAARDTIEENPEFALGVALASLRWLCEGWGYEITGVDVLAAYGYAMKAAERLEEKETVSQKIQSLVTGDGLGGKFVKDVLGSRLGKP
ncbi:MAG: hypothetical protein HQL52_19320 [Magnetococcales bacterium]|nr:hypothetical protein [Magnetococcales bacterium]